MEDFCVSHNYTQRDLLLLLPPSSSSSSNSHRRPPPPPPSLLLLQQQQPPPSSSSSAAAAAAAIALKFHPKHEKQKQNETHYENITHKRKHLFFLIFFQTIMFEIQCYMCDVIKTFHFPVFKNKKKWKKKYIYK